MLPVGSRLTPGGRMAVGCAAGRFVLARGGVSVAGGARLQYVGQGGGALSV